MVSPFDEISSKPLTEDILRKKPPFIFGYYEWLSVQGERIMESSDSATTNDVMFTVPERKTLYITGCDIGGSVTVLGVGGTAAIFMFVEQSDQMLVGSKTNVINLSMGNSQSFPIPLKVEEGERIITSGQGTFRLLAKFHGFLIDKRII